MIPNSNAWLTWRNDGQGSSDAPVLTGNSPYKTPNRLYLEKIGEVLPLAGNEFIFEKGHKTEAQARSLLEIEYGGIDFSPMLCQMIDYPFMRASLDGVNFQENVAKEFKLVSLAEFNAGVCPKRYYDQIQHQYVVTGIGRIDIVLCCHIGKLKTLKIKEVFVPMDMEYILNVLMPAELDFRWRIDNRVPPPLVPDDAIRIKDKSIIEKIKKGNANTRKIEKLSAEIDKLIKANQIIVDDIAQWLPEPYMYYQKQTYKVEAKKIVRVECI